MPIVDLIRRFFPYVAAVKRQAITNLALVLIAPLLAAALLWAFKLLIDDVLVAGKTDLLGWYVVIFCAAAAGKIVAEYAAQWLEANTIESILLSLRTDVYAHVLSLSPGSLGSSSTGDVLTRLEGDTTRTETLIYTAPLIAIADGAAAVVFTFLLFTLNWQLALFATAALPLIAWVIAAISPAVRRTSQLSRSAESSWMTLAEERLNSISLVHAFDALERERRAFNRRCNKVRRMEVASLVLQARQSALVEVIIAAAGLGVLAWGAMLIKAGSLTVGELIAFVGTVGALYAPVRSLGKTAGRFQNAAAGAQRIATILDRTSKVREKLGATTLNFVRGAIEFRGVTFGYSEGDPVVSNVSFNVLPGETVAIVGQSGSGKSSLLRLLLRQYDTDSGSIHIDGHDIRDLKISTLRCAISPVFQDALVLNGSIEANIRYGQTGASPSDVAKAAHGAAVSDFANKKGGLHAPVGVGGAFLSGGQRQRIALARAIVRDAPILVLDEATSGVDSETEDTIQAALEAWSGKRTILVVAHRLSSIRSADHIVVMEHGRVIETGTPSELLQRPSRCRTLFAAQMAVREAAE